MSKATTLSPEDRLNNYAKTGRVWITPTQARRYSKKWRKFNGVKDFEEYYRNWIRTHSPYLLEE